ncbi:MAG: hypothetical protein RL679_341 [Bacteroidota bacterium]|jgi:hypothetical protein
MDKNCEIDEFIIQTPNLFLHLLNYKEKSTWQKATKQQEKKVMVHLLR